MALLTRLLLDEGVIDYEGVEEGIKAQVLYGGRIGTNLLYLNLITEDQLCRALSRCHGIPSVMLGDGDVEAEAVRAIPEKYVRNYKVFPFRRKSRTVSLAMADPGRRAHIADISYTTGLIIKPYVTPEHRLDEMLERHYEIPLPWRYQESYDEVVLADDDLPEAERTFQPIDMETAQQLLDSAERGRQVPDTILSLARNHFKRAALLIVRGGEMLGFGGFHDEDLMEEGLVLPLTEDSAFGSIVDLGTTTRGRLRGAEVEKHLWKALGGEKPRSAFIAPISLRGRVVNILYGDAGVGRELEGDLGDFIVFLNRAAQAYERIVRMRVQTSLKES